MKLAQFIRASSEQILAEWEAHARSLSPASDDMSLTQLRDHAEKILAAIAQDMSTAQTPEEQEKKSLGQGASEDGKSAASHHGEDRYGENFTLVQLGSEFRALRASVLRLWTREVRGTNKEKFEDVTRFNEAVDQALAESIDGFSGRAGDARDMFEAILGHDLRGPLASVTLAGAMIRRRPLTAREAEVIGCGLEHGARVMTAMVDDLLGFAATRLGNGLPIHRRLVDIARLCEDAIEDARAMHPACTIDLETEGRLDAQLDENRMHQLLVNLLGNACQHGAPGKPIHCITHADDEQIVISVVNEGKQIPEHDLHRIFQPFVQLAAEKRLDARPCTSLGLGLHIAHEIAHGHGGEIHVTSTVHHTEFVVEFPRTADA